MKKRRIEQVHATRPLGVVTGVLVDLLPGAEDALRRTTAAKRGKLAQRMGEALMPWMKLKAPGRISPEGVTARKL